MTALKCGGQCTAQNEREETIYCSKVSWTSISASLNVYHRLLASEPCLAALLAASLSLPRYLTPLFSLFYSRSTLPAFSLSFTSNLCPLTSHFFSLLGIPSFSQDLQCLYRQHLCLKSLCLVFIFVAPPQHSYSPSTLHHLSLFMSALSLSLSPIRFASFFFSYPTTPFTKSPACKKCLSSIKVG